MQRIISFFFKVFRKIFRSIRLYINQIRCRTLFYANNVSFTNLRTNGMPFLAKSSRGKFSIGQDFKMNNGLVGNPIGCPQPCVFFIGENAILEIGNNVGMSQTAIVCHCKVIIRDSVKIGGGVCIYDTDFHSLDPDKRRDPQMDFSDKCNSPVFIDENVFIGAHSTILKGVTIGVNSIVGACSVVTKNIPANEIWAGNPAKFVREIILDK